MDVENVKEAVKRVEKIVNEIIVNVNEILANDIKEDETLQSILSKSSVRLKLKDVLRYETIEIKHSDYSYINGEWAIKFEGRDYDYVFLYPQLTDIALECLACELKKQKTFKEVIIEERMDSANALIAVIR